MITEFDKAVKKMVKDKHRRFRKSLKAVEDAGRRYFHRPIQKKKVTKNYGSVL